MNLVTVNDKMQSAYTYALVEPMGENFDDIFEPELTPKEMLGLGVFGGKYLNDCKNEFPKDWFLAAKLSKTKNVELNYFSVDASQPLSEWIKKGWINKQDPRGWFQWYCRYTLGRRVSGVDCYQIGRWKAFGPRHIGGIRANCEPIDLDCRPRQRQALLHWAYDPFI